jgi:uncharacterized membrane protein
VRRREIGWVGSSAPVDRSGAAKSMASFSADTSPLNQASVVEEGQANVLSIALRFPACQALVNPHFRGGLHEHGRRRARAPVGRNVRGRRDAKKCGHILVCVGQQPSTVGRRSTMELCILKFEGSRGAEDALSDVVDAQADRYPWLHEVAVVARPLVGRVRIGVTFPDGKSSTFHEGDLAEAISDLGAYTGYYVSSLAGPLSAMFGAVNAAAGASDLGSEAEQRLFHLEEVKNALPRDSSALALIAEPRICDEMVQLFTIYEPKIIRREVADELRTRLDGLHQRVAQGILSGGAAATH